MTVGGEKNGRASREEQVPRCARNDGQKSRSKSNSKCDSNYKCNGNRNCKDNYRGPSPSLRSRVRMTT
jgi:hypothetical protein